MKSPYRQRSVFAAALFTAILLGSCGGGGNGQQVGGQGVEKGVFTGFRGDFAWQMQGNAEGGFGEGEGIGGGADGDGGFGVGGALGQFRGALVKVFFPDGELLGEALTDNATGMVTVKPGATYDGALLIEIHGQPGATYFEEGKNAYVPYESGRVLHSIVNRVTRNVGITPFSEAGYQLSVRCQNGQGPQTVCGQGQGQSNQTLPGSDAIAAANDHVRNVLNQQFPSTLQVDDVTRLPFIVNDGTARGTLNTSERGRYGLVNIAFSKQAAMYNTTDPAPTLLATEQLSNDLLDGKLDGRNADGSAATAARRTYDPHTLTSELSSALAQQTSRYGSADALAALPQIVAFGNVRYDGYYFDAKVGASGATSTIAVATETASTERLPGDITEYVRPQNDLRGFMVYGNMGSGTLFVKTDSADSTSRIVALGDNSNGELGNGTSGSVEQPVLVSFPGILTHAVGGFGHTLTRLSDGSVFAFGDNSEGQLGQGLGAIALPSSSLPRPVPLPSGAVSIAAANGSSFALLDNGAVYSWGSGWGFGTLGDGSPNGLRLSPAPVQSTSGVLNNVVQVSARDNDAVALKADGTVWTWGSFTQSESNLAPFGVKPGNTVATQVSGLPAAPIRKVLTEQGLFIALIGDSNGAENNQERGAVYTWGIHFDITAQDYLYDLQPVRVLNLPPVRDIMPGGFNGYGQRPFDRLTAMAVDYSGRFWKIRGQVAERYDPSNPIAQRRPQGQAPRKDCASCHTVRPAIDMPLPTTGPACVIPSFKLDNNGVPLLVNSASDCTACHNGGTLSNGSVLAPLSCVVPALPAPRAPTNATAQTSQCALPVQHPVTPAGSFCATCHNSVVTAPLACAPERGVIPPPSTTTVTITGALDNTGPITGNIAAGGLTDDTTPTLSGSLGTALVSGERVEVRSNGGALGDASVSGTTWTYTPAALAEGSYSFTARVVNAGGAVGTPSAAYALSVSTSTVTTTVQITGVVDDVGIRTGTISAGGVTNDPNPVVTGRLSDLLPPAHVLRLERRGPDGTRILDVTSVTQLQWSVTDNNALAANDLYRYSAKVVSLTGAQGPASIDYTIRFDNQPPLAPRVVEVFADFPASLNVPVSGSIAPGGGTNDNTPLIRAALSNPQIGDGIEFYEANTILSNGPVAVDGQGRASYTHQTQFPLGRTADINAFYLLDYNVIAVDEAGNRSARSANHRVNFGFFGCETLRARFNHFSATSSCAQCHATHVTNNVVRRLSVPDVGAYWCSLGRGDLTPLPRP